MLQRSGETRTSGRDGPLALTHAFGPRVNTSRETGGKPKTGVARAYNDISIDRCINEL